MNKDNRYRIKMEAINPEYAQDNKLFSKDGIEVSGFFLLGFTNGEPSAIIVDGINRMDVATSIAADPQLLSIAVLAKAIREAGDIEREAKISNLASLLKGGNA